MPEPICSECGAVRDEGALICPKCGFKVEDRQYLKKPYLAGLLSLYPGLGQVYNGQLPKGVLIFVAALLFGLFVPMVPIIPGIIVWVLGIAEAFITARNMNSGKITPKSTNSIRMVAFVMGTIVLLFLVLAIATAFIEILKFMGISG